MMSKLFSCLVLLVALSNSFAEGFDYKLKPEKIAKDTYFFKGLNEDFTRTNGGNIVNTGFIITPQGVIIIDVGPSKLYGQQMKASIEKLTDKKIIKIFLTHQHPDHFLGMQAFGDTPVYANQETIDALKVQADSYLDNMYRMVGDSMRETEANVDRIIPNVLSEEVFDGHTLNYIKLTGHTDSDLMILDSTTGVLFAGDQVFHNRALTTPHASPDKWLQSLDRIIGLDFKIIVPGHGEVSTDKIPVKQTKEYLIWLESTISAGVEQGLDMNELLAVEIPARFQSIALTKSEFARSVSHLFKKYEDDIFNTSDK